MRNLSHVEHLAEQLRNLNRGSTYQARASTISHLFYFVNDGSIFLTSGFVHTVVHIIALDRTVGRYLYHIQFIDVPELPCLCRCSTCHTCQLMVHTEVVLQRNGCKGLCGSFHFYMLLRLHCLMQSIAPTAAFHDTSCLFVNDFYFAIHHNVFIVFVEHGICLQQLLQGMNTFTLHTIVGQQFIFLINTLLIRKICFVL